MFLGLFVEISAGMHVAANIDGAVYMIITVEYVIRMFPFGRACVADEAPRVGENGTRAHAIDIFRDLPSVHVEFEV